MNDKSENLAARIALRPVVMPDDEDFLIKVYFSTREDLDALPIDVEQKNMIKRMQYEAQKNHYSDNYPNAAHDIVLFDNKEIGRLMSERKDKELLGVDLAILPEYRNLGIGTYLLQNLIDEAVNTNRVFSLHVLKNSTAIRLYTRLGMVVTGDIGTHFQMERRLPPEIAV